ncbi:MAG TPA: hypothetical protein VGI70_08030, partial [Polyangiales bacterium]
VGAMIADAGAEPVPDVSLQISLARDPRCPSEPPQVGDACLPDPAPLHCEYGGDATRRCTTIARCGLQADGSFSFQLETDTRCVPNAADCLARFDSDAASSIDAADGGDSDPCGDHYLSCDYPEGACACLPQSFSLFTWTCRSRGDVTPTPATALACPKVRPLAGDSCANEGETCDYDGTCESRPSLGPTMFCQSGYWKRLDAIYECPALPP